MTWLLTVLGVAFVLASVLLAFGAPNTLVSGPRWLFRWAVVEHGNSAWNDDHEQVVGVFVLRARARRRARWRNTASRTGTGILKCVVERR